MYASTTKIIQIWRWVDLESFYAKVKFVTQAFVRAKVKILFFFSFFETIAAIGLKVGLSIQLNKLMKLKEYHRSRSFFDLGQRSLRFQN